MKMNKEVKKKWVEALRGGDYEQATERLRDSFGGGYGYCCLGVLCDLYAKERGIEWSKEDELLGEAAHLPEAVRDWARLPIDAGARVFFRGYKNRHVELTEINDDGESFREIADAIEEQL